MKYILIFLSLFFIGCIYTPYNSHKHTKHKKEKYYQYKLCKKLHGKMEYRLKDNTRVDCITNKYAIEVDWAKKWAEAIGQSLYYAKMTGKQPAIGLICSKNDNRFKKRVLKIAKKYNIKLFFIKK